MTENAKKIKPETLTSIFNIMDSCALNEKMKEIDELHYTKKKIFISSPFSRKAR